MNKITTAGVDRAKSVLSMRGVDAYGRALLRKSVRGDKLMQHSVTAAAAP